MNQMIIRKVENGFYLIHSIEGKKDKCHVYETIDKLIMDMRNLFKEEPK